MNCNDTTNPLVLACLGIYAQNIIAAAVLFVGAVAVIVIIFGGIKYVMSSGDAKKLDDAKKTIIYGIVGLLIVLAAGAIVTFIAKKTNTDTGVLTNPFLVPSAQK